MIAAAQVPWLTLRQGSAPLLLCMPHTGTTIPPEIEARLVSPWLARKDTDWRIERLYAFAADLGASIVGTTISRTVIDCNRDRAGASPQAPEIDARRSEYYDPYHHTIEHEITRLRALHPSIVLYDCHSIRSRIPRLFTGTLPHFNIGTFAGASCAPELTSRIERVCDRGPFSRVTNGRFQGGYTTRHYGHPDQGVHAVQMELACRGYLREPQGEVDVANWPCPWDEALAAPMSAKLHEVLAACLAFAAAVPA